MTINGKTCESLGSRVEQGDQVTVDGQQAAPDDTDVSLILYKPPGYLCTRNDPEGRETIYDLLPGHLSRSRSLHNAGRLDRDSEGLLILTTDGDLSQQLTHPSHSVKKEYLVTLSTPYRQEDTAKMLSGIKTPVGLAKAVAVEKVSKRAIAIVLEQGLKRQIRYMLDELGYGVKRLIRVRIGGLTEPGLKPGQWRQIGRRDLDRLFE